MNQKQLLKLLEKIEPGLPERILQRMNECIDGSGDIETALYLHKKYKNHGGTFMKACFIWEWTPEGHDYWQEIDQKINEELK